MENNANGQKDLLLPASIVAAALIVAGAWMYVRGPQQAERGRAQAPASVAPAARDLAAAVLPDDGVILPVRWGDLGAKMVSAGVVDAEKFESLYASRGELDAEAKQLLSGTDTGNLKITSENSGLLLNLLWALGLGTKNPILENGPMADPAYGSPANFASTAGWTLAKGGAMSHYSRHPFIVLTPEQQQLVEVVAKNIYRPCCDNPTFFPDCNHGMAMLGLLELMASQGVEEEEMYRIALRVNAYWFPDTYLAIGKYLTSKGIAWDRADPKEILGAAYSSASGYRRVLAALTAPVKERGASCSL